MSETIRVYVNALGIDVPKGSTALDAVRHWKESEADALVAGERRLTDSRGLPAAPDAPVFGGAILRVIPTRSRAADADGDVGSVS